MSLKDQLGSNRGVPFAISSALLLGLTPIFGKQALNAGMLPLTVVAARTAGATSLLFLVVLTFRRRYLYIFPLGLVGCFIAGGLNGIGSLLYYSALARIDAGLGQLLYGLYPVFVAVLLYLDGQRHTRGTLLSLALSLPAVYLLTQASASHIDSVGIGLMLGAGLLYALHIPINQRVLYEAPAPTVTLYTLFAMTVVVVPAHFIFSPSLVGFPQAALQPLIWLTAVTFLSRLTLFAGVKSIGGMRTSLLGLIELLVAVGLANFLLGESLSAAQWLGAVLLGFALIWTGRDRTRTTITRRSGWLQWLRPPISLPAPPPFKIPDPASDETAWQNHQQDEGSEDKPR